MTFYNVHRRIFFKQVASLGVALGTAGWFSVVHAETGSFEGLVLFLTEREFINHDFLQQTYQALLAKNNQLDQDIKNLSEVITDQKIKNVASLMHYLKQSKQVALETVAQQTIEALYTGVVGQGDKASYVNYQMALMFEPTLGVITIPTYVNARPEYWSARPE